MQLGEAACPGCRSACAGSGGALRASVTARAAIAWRASEHAAERMAVEQIAEFEVLAEHVEALVAAEPLQLGRMDAALHAGGQRAALEAVAAEIAQSKAGRDGAGLDDLRPRSAAHAGADAGAGRDRGPGWRGARRRAPASDAAAARSGGTLGRR